MTMLSRLDGEVARALVAMLGVRKALSKARAVLISLGKDRQVFHVLDEIVLVIGLRLQQLGQAPNR